MRYSQADPRNDALPCAGELNSSLSVGLPRSRPAFPRRSVVQALLQSLKGQECHDERKRLNRPACNSNICH